MEFKPEMGGPYTSVGIDVGGTFTDVIAFDARVGEFVTAKVPTTAENQSIGFLEGLDRLNIPFQALGSLVHGTTVGTNAVLERKGARCGLITTRGFRDTLELGRRTRPHTFGMVGTFEPLIPREMRLEVRERTDAFGNILVPLDEDDVRDAIRRLLAADAEALLIHFLHSYQNPEHEERCLAIALQMWPNQYVTIGSRILRQIREFERGSTAAVNAYVQPVISRYLQELSSELQAGGFRSELLITKGNGGTISAQIACDNAVETVLSGPAAGVISAARIASQAGFQNVITGDMGGTSFDVTMIHEGAPSITFERDIDYSVPVRVPLVDIHTIGAGGGSIAFVNAAGILQVGPKSAGSWPGPICYGRGGKEPTVTDANLILGRLDPSSLPGFSGGLDLEYVRTTIDEKIGQPLGLEATRAARAIVEVANAQMAGAIRLVSLDRGHDPRDFVFFAFGGAGPMHAVELAKELSISTVIIPRFPGITSALGCILADIRHDFVRYLDQFLDEIAQDEVEKIFSTHETKGRSLIGQEIIKADRIEVFHELDVAYQGQTHLIPIPVRGTGFDRQQIADDFSRVFTERFDIAIDDMRLILGNIRTTVVGHRTQIDLRLLATGLSAKRPRKVSAQSRSVHFDDKWITTPVLKHYHLNVGDTIHGPAIIEQMDSTIVITPTASGTIDEFGNLILTVR